jgi:hypothetical protein
MIDEPCFNIAAAALILRSYLAETGGALLPAVGDYHSHTPALNLAYQLEAEGTVVKLFAGRDAAGIRPTYSESHKPHGN